MLFEDRPNLNSISMSLSDAVFSLYNKAKLDMISEKHYIVMASTNQWLI